jgi:hypothetical protein
MSLVPYGDAEVLAGERAARAQVSRAVPVLPRWLSVELRAIIIFVPLATLRRVA